MDCVCKLCGGVDSQHHIILDCTHREMASCRDKHIALLKRRSSDITARRYQAAPYFEVYTWTSPSRQVWTLVLTRPGRASLTND